MQNDNFQYTKAEGIPRAIAKIIDLVLIIALALIYNPIGPIVAIFYSIFSDAIDGKSLGKRLVGLQVLNVVNKTPGGIKESIIRNIPIVIFIFFASIPVFWILLILIGIPLLILELYLFWTLETKNRIGDILADTTVIETKKK